MDNVLKEMEISPSLKEILKMLDDPYRATTEAEAAARQSSGVLEKEDTVSPWQDGNTGEEDDEFSEVFDTADPNVYEDDNDFGGGFETGGDSPGMNTWNDLNPGLEDEEASLPLFSITCSPCLSCGQTYDFSNSCKHVNSC